MNAQIMPTKALHQMALTIYWYEKGSSNKSIMLVGVFAIAVEDEGSLII